MKRGSAILSKHAGQSAAMGAWDAVAESQACAEFFPSLHKEKGELKTEKERRSAFASLARLPPKCRYVSFSLPLIAPERHALQATVLPLIPVPPSLFGSALSIRCQQSDSLSFVLGANIRIKLRFTKLQHRNPKEPRVKDWRVQNHLLLLDLA